MSTDSLSDAQLSAKDSGLHIMEQAPMIQTANPPTNNITDVPLPLEAARSVVAKYIETLHFDLQPFLSPLAQECLTKYSAYHHHTVRAQDLVLHPQKIPPSVRNVKFILQPLDEQFGSEGYQALQSDLTSELELFRRKLIDKFVKPLDDMKSAVYLKRFHLAICKLLREGAKGFMYQLNLINHNVDQAIIDFVASKPYGFFHAPLPTDMSSFLQLYKEANKEVTILPLPTNNDAELSHLIDTLNTGSTNITSTLGTQCSPPSSITTSIQEGSTPQRVGTSFETSISHASTAVTTTLPTPRNNIPAVTPGTSLLASDLPGTTTPTETPGTLPAVPQTVQSPYVVRGRQQHVTPRTSVTIDTSLPMPPRVQLPNNHPNCSNVGINGTPFYSAQTVLMAQQMTNTLMNNLAQSPFTADESEILNETDEANKSTTSHESGNTQEPNDSQNNDINFSSQPEFSEADLTSITTATNKHVLQMRIIDLYTKAVRLPIKDFLTAVTAREESLRIRQLTTPSIQNSLSARVAEKIQSERPADQATLRGLIREEQEKSTTSIRQVLQSALHRLDRFEQEHKLNKQTSNEQPNRKPSAKKSKGGNTNQTKDGTRRKEASIVAADYSASNLTPSLPASPPSTLGWGRKRPRVTFSKPLEQSSVTAESNASTAPKPKRARHWRKSQRKTPQK